MSLAHRGTVPHRHFDFFYSNKNNLVQLEDTTIKTERGCSMQRTERTTVAHHRSDLFYHTWGEWVELTDKKSEVRQTRRWQKSFKTKCKSACFKNILDFEKPVDVCH